MRPTVRSHRLDAQLRGYRGPDQGGHQREQRPGV
jgi:hypothetical protein